MTARKPANISWESWVDLQIREARERGEFENLPGAGQRIASMELSDDENWWIKQLVRRENLSVLPPSLQLRKDVEDAVARIARTRSEAEVRTILAAINQRIVDANRTSLDGPPTSLMPFDVERIVASWREGGLA